MRRVIKKDEVNLKISLEQGEAIEKLILGEGSAVVFTDTEGTHWRVTHNEGILTISDGCKKKIRVTVKEIE